MSGLVVVKPEVVIPGWVARNERARGQLEADEHIRSERRHWDPLLQSLDHRLSLRKARSLRDARVPVAPGIIPGYWHVIRKGDGCPDTAWVITSKGLGVFPGDYREMSDDVLDVLRRGDLWNGAVTHEAQTVARRVEESKERARVTRKEARVDDLAINIRALDSPGVSMSDTGWTWKKSGQRGRKV